MLEAILALFVAACVTAAICPRLISALAAHRLVDTAIDRSSHAGEVPRGGGIAIVIGLLCALVVTSGVWVGRQGYLVEVFAVLLFGLLGLADDLKGLSALSRLIAQGVMALVVAALLHAPTDPSAVLAIGLSAVWLAAFVNAFNFMDGINGISVATTAVIGTSLAISSLRWAPGMELLALGIVGACIGFAPFNAANRIFLGDVGSYLLGSALAVLSVVGITRGIPPVAVLLPFGLYVADVGFTLWRRAARGERLMQAHREHVYQRLANEGGWGHTRVTLAVASLTLLLAVAAQVSGEASLPLLVVSLSLSAVLIGGYLTSPIWTGRETQVQTQ